MLEVYLEIKTSPTGACTKHYNNKGIVQKLDFWQNLGCVAFLTLTSSILISERIGLFSQSLWVIKRHMFDYIFRVKWYDRMLVEPALRSGYYNQPFGLLNHVETS